MAMSFSSAPCTGMSKKWANGDSYAFVIPVPANEGIKKQANKDEATSETFEDESACEIEHLYYGRLSTAYGAVASSWKLPRSETNTLPSLRLPFLGSNRARSPLGPNRQPRETKLGDLLTLCPTCHYLAHYLLRESRQYKQPGVLLDKLRSLRRHGNSE